MISRNKVSIVRYSSIKGRVLLTQTYVLRLHRSGQLVAITSLDISLAVATCSSGRGLEPKLVKILATLMFNVDLNLMGFLSRIAHPVC